jgi:hypothetical protein
VNGNVTVELVNGAPSEGHSPNALGPYGPGLQAGENRTFLSVYTPLGVSSSSLGAMPLDLQSGAELGQHVYSAFVDIPSEGTGTVRLSVDGMIHLAAGGWYTLDIPRQPALGADQLSISLTVPPGWEVRSGSPTSTWSRHADLRVDQTGPLGIRLQIRQADGPGLLEPVALAPSPCPPELAPSSQPSLC